MADPIQTFLGSDNGMAGVLDKLNTNFAKRHHLDQRLTADANVTLVDTDEWVRCSATTAARSCTLPLAASHPGRVIEFFVLASDVTNTFTFNRTGADTIDGSTSLVVNTNRKKLAFRSDGVSDWVKYELT